MPTALLNEKNIELSIYVPIKQELFEKLQLDICLLSSNDIHKHYTVIWG